MSFEFNADEVFEMAEQIERNGAEFYRQAAATVTNDSAGRDFLLKLARMEESHEDVFSDIRASLTDEQRSSTAADLDNDAIGYLRSLADTRIFFNKEIDTSSMGEILKAAIMTEKDSIAFYLGMKELVSDKHGKDKIDQIINEEMDHIRLLSQELISRNSDPD